MNRRRIMMLQQKVDSGIEIPTKYQRNYEVYYSPISWNNGTVTLAHTRYGFGGPAQVFIQFIGPQNKYAHDMAQAFSVESTPLMDFLDSTKRYKLTLTVINVNQNTSTDNTEDIFTLAIGKRNARYSKEVNIKDIKAGTKIEVEMTYATGFCCAVFGITAGSALWSFDFDVKIEEV